MLFNVFFGSRNFLGHCIWHHIQFVLKLSARGRLLRRQYRGYFR